MLKVGQCSRFPCAESPVSSPPLGAALQSSLQGLNRGVFLLGLPLFATSKVTLRSGQRKMPKAASPKGHTSCKRSWRRLLQAVLGGSRV